jgi:predicted ATPase/DNA-binding SARP family transcriptional activator
MRFGILGPFEVVDDEGRELALGGPKQRAVLAVLLLHAGEVISSDRLIDDVWGDRAPRTAAKTIQVYVSNLRKALGNGRLTTHGQGYTLRTEDAEIDADRFDALVADGRRELDAGNPQAAVESLRQALGLWRGRPLVEFAYEPFAQNEVARLEETRLAALENRFEAELALGQDAGLVAELEALVREHPWRERLHAQLMLALYRAGRQADALEVYRGARAHLADELGLEPGPALRALHAQVLEQSPALEPEANRSAHRHTPSTRVGIRAPEGTIALLFTDIEGSTQLATELGPDWARVLAEHQELVGGALAAGGGFVEGTEGDAFFATFPDAQAAARAAVAAMRSLRSHSWPEAVGELRVRMGLHVGRVDRTEIGYVGLEVHRAARVTAAAHGGQLLLTAVARELVGDELVCESVGVHRLKDFPAPLQLFCAMIDGRGAADFPPPRTESSLNRSNLRTPANPLVGRRTETERALELLSRPETHLLTLQGVGGAGKTRLAVEVAGEAVTRYRDGVWIVPLAPIGDRSLMVSEIARVLRVDPVAEEPLETTLVRTLADRELLLVLDNFEHLLDAAEIVAQLLAAAPKLDVLTTSREALRISGEHLMEVPPLPASDAVELFVQRALAVRPDLSIEGRDREAISRICERLDCLPLALELAAARIAVFGPRALEARLANNLALAQGPRDVPERQRTLGATIDWSYQLLEPEQQWLFESLAPFIGGVRLDSAEPLWGQEAVEGLISLASKSLLRRREDPDQEPRFWMLETVRQFAVEKAMEHAAGDGETERHAEYFAALAAEAAPNLSSADQGPWLDRLESEMPNLRAALDRLTTRNPELALRMAVDLFWFWDVRGYLAEGRRRLLEVLSITDGGGRDRAQALFGAGHLSMMADEFSVSVPQLRDAAAMAQEAGEIRLAIHALSNLAWAYQSLGERNQAASIEEKTIALARASNDTWALALALNNSGDGFSMVGEFEQARPLFEAALELRRGGEPRAIALTAANLAQVTLGDGELETTEALVAEGLDHARRINYHPILITLRSVGALTALHREDPAAARSQLIEAIPSLPGVDAEAGTIFLAAAATLASIDGHPLHAATLWGATEGALAKLHRAETPGAGTLRTRWLPAARDAAPDIPAWDTAFIRGAEMSLDAALALAAGDFPPGSL